MKKFPHHFAVSLAVFALIALLLAQLGAVNHAYSHIPQTSATVKTVNSASHALCDDCLSFAPLLSAAGSSVVVSFIAPPARAIALRAVAASLLNNRLDLAFRSRAPPLVA